MTPRVALLTVGLIFCHLMLRVALGIEAGVPDLMLLAVMIVSRFGSAGAGVALGLACGLVEDAMAVFSFGASAIALTVTAALASQARHLMIGHPVPFMAIFFGLGKWLRDLVGWLASDPVSRAGFHDHVLTTAPLSAAYAGVVGALACVLVLGRSLRR